MIFKNGIVFIDGHFVKKDIRTEGRKIVEIADDIVQTEEVIDCTGKKLLPGFVEIHSHGCVGYDFSNADLEGLKEMCNHYASCGVTSILATTMTNEFDLYRQAMRNIKQVMENQEKGSCEGSRILGINMEGPFLGVDKKGAHDPNYLLPIDEKFFEELDDLSGNAIRLVDLDPCLEGAIEFIEKYHTKKVISLAHTSCDYALAQRAVLAGASHITHLFNAMNGLHHREPSLIGAVVDFPLDAELICDGIHVHPSVIRLMFRAVPEKIVVISDSMSAAGFSDGEYELGGQKVFVKDKKATLASGTIAGSTAQLYEEFLNLLKFGIPEEQAICSVSSNPANSVNCGDIAGSILVGRDADILVTGEKYQLEQVYLRGQAWNTCNFK